MLGLILCSFPPFFSSHSLLPHLGEVIIGLILWCSQAFWSFSSPPPLGYVSRSSRPDSAELPVPAISLPFSSFSSLSLQPHPHPQVFFSLLPLSVLHLFTLDFPHGKLVICIDSALWINNRSRMISPFISPFNLSLTAISFLYSNSCSSTVGNHRRSQRRLVWLEEKKVQSFNT